MSDNLISVTVYRVLTIRTDMILKIDTGMSLSRISSLTTARKSGITSAATYRGALRDVNAWLQAQGVPARWSRKWPQG